MKIRTKRYKKLMRAVLKYQFAEDGREIAELEQVLLRIAYHDGYVELDNDEYFVLSDKGLRLIRE